MGNLSKGQHIITLTAVDSKGAKSSAKVTIIIETLQGLIGWWKFDAGSGNTAYDSSGNGINGVIHGVTYTEGISGTALEFDIGDYVDLGDNPKLYACSMTITEWVKIEGGASSYMMAVNDYSSDQGEWGFGTGIDKDGSPFVSIGAGFNNHALGAHSRMPINDGAWHLIGATYSNSEKKIRLYIDGNLASENNWSSKEGFDTSTDVLAHNSHLYFWYIGVISEYFDNAEIGPHHYKGVIDEIMVFNRALSPGEIKSYYDSVISKKSR